MPGQERHHLRTGLQDRHIGVEVDPVQALDIQRNWADHTDFYPPELEKGSRQREKLAWYAQFFPIVEVDSSFYAIPRPATTERWARETPPGFTFNVKAFRTFTGHGLPDDRYACPTEDQSASLPKR